MSDLFESVENIMKEHKEILDEFEKWISIQSHIPKNIPKIILLRYLKVCNFNLEEAENLLDINVKFRIKHQYLFINRSLESEEFQRIMKTVQYTRLPKLSKEGYAIEIHRVIDPNGNNFIITDVFKANFMTHDMYNLIGQVENGVIGIFDAQKFTFQHFLQVLAHPSAVMHFLQFGQEATCMEIKQIHMVNCSSIISRVIKFLKPFITKDLYEKLHFHSSGYETLHQFVDKDYLPVEFGGWGGSIDDYMKNTLNDLHLHRDFILKDKNFFLLSD